MVASHEETGSALLDLSNDLAQAVERAGLATVTVHGRARTPASGVHWQRGTIVAADHTLERDDGITVTFPDGRSVAATVAGRDPGTDLAVLSVEAGDRPVAEIGDSAGLKIGHMVLAVGRPGEHGLAASWGAISAIGPAWRTWSGGRLDQLIRPDLTLYPGFSGGPLVDARGTVVGINTSGLSRSLTLAIPTATVRRVAETLLARGHIARGYLGIATQPVRLPEAQRTALGLSGETGLIVVHVESDGPAERAGVLVGDILVAIDGETVTDTDDIQSRLDPDRVGTALALRLVRGGRPEEVSVTVGERPRKGE